MTSKLAWVHNQNGIDPEAWVTTPLPGKTHEGENRPMFTRTHFGADDTPEPDW